MVTLKEAKAAAEALKVALTVMEAAKRAQDVILSGSIMGTPERGSEFSQIRTALNLLEARIEKWREEPPFRVMLSDESMDWVQIDPTKTESPRAAFKSFHHREPSGKCVMIVCPPETKWGGCGDYSIPSGEWTPTTIGVVRIVKG